jgi:hypothetical protein
VTDARAGDAKFAAAGEILARLPGLERASWVRRNLPRREGPPARSLMRWVSTFRLAALWRKPLLIHHWFSDGTASQSHVTVMG